MWESGKFKTYLKVLNCDLIIQRRNLESSSISLALLCYFSFVKAMETYEKKILQNSYWTKVSYLVVKYEVIEI